MPQPSSERTVERATRKVREGIVVSNKMDKTAVVKVERTLRHPLYKKVIRRSKRYLVHDEENASKVGDTVRITECRPLSRHKRWRLLEVVSHGE